MNVGAVSAVGSGVAPVYAALSPYRSGVVRMSDAAAAAQPAATVASTSAAITAAPPFANPAITAIGLRIALSLRSPAPTASPTESVLFGDGGTLVQSYGAVALVAGSQALPPVYPRANLPAIPPVTPV
jgi:hypothetical protein